MTGGEQNSSEHAVVALIDAVRARRDLETTQAATADFEFNEELERAHSLPTTLSDASYELLNQMAWLHKHRRRLGFMGKTALLPNVKGSALETPLLLATQAELTDYPNITTGYIFTALPHREAPFYSGMRMDIDEIIADTQTQERRVNNSWSITTNHLCEDKKDIKLESDALREMRRGKVEETLSRYREEFPWLYSYGMYDDQGDVRIYISTEESFTLAGLRELRLAELLSQKDVRRPEPKQVQAVLDEMAHAATLGQGWEYPDEVYMLPLGLLRAARKELSVRKHR